MADKKDYLTAKEFAEKHNIGRSTVSLWCRNGTLKGAFQEETPFGKVWYIPKVTSNTFKKPERGRPSAKNPSKATLAKRAQREREKADKSNIQK